MKTLELKKMEQIEGGSCSGAIATTILTGVAIAGMSAGLGTIAAIVGAYANAELVYEECF